jgi:hypothetical protein
MGCILPPLRGWSTAVFSNRSGTTPWPLEPAPAALVFLIPPKAAAFQNTVTSRGSIPPKAAGFQNTVTSR